MSREFLEEFIKIYESEPCLWQVKNKLYHDRVSKEAAYTRLIEKLKTSEPNASKDSVVKKINNIRSAYRKEIKKVKASHKTGTGTDEVYEPKLWYFKLLRFLDDQDTPRSSRSNIDSLEEDDVTSNNEENGEEDVFQDNSANNEAETPTSEDATWVEKVREATADAGQSFLAVTPQRRPSNKKRLHETQEQTLTNEVLLTVKEHFKTPRVAEDRFEVFGKTVAMKLRGLQKEQMLIAEKLINDTLFQAEMGNLTLSYRLTGEAIPQSCYPHNFNRYHSPLPSPTYSHSHSPSPTFNAPSPSVQSQQQYQQPQSQRNCNRQLLSNVTESQHEQLPQSSVDNYFSQFNEL